ncbi:hypothetical protein A2U01_0045437, partial [Trifolium medium]|nr:hypothetical protein [Trifolium medium]
MVEAEASLGVKPSPSEVSSAAATTAYVSSTSVIISCVVRKNSRTELEEAIAIVYGHELASTFKIHE